MQIAFLAVLLAAIFSLFFDCVRDDLSTAMRQQPRLVWAVPPVLTAYFLAASVASGGVSWELILIVLVYTGAPVACAWWNAPDFLTIALLWLPLEFPAGAAHLIAKHAQGFLHSVAYGIAILLGVVVFACFRRISGMKINWPREWGDLWRAVVGFAVAAPVLAAIGIPIGFIPMPHWPIANPGRMAAAAGIILAGTAVPEEILFRSMIQNLLMQRFGASVRTLAVAALIFGAAHLDNGPQALPNWRYFILASIAGFAYGRVFQASTTVLASALFHMLVDWTKHFFF
jgi:membrane protease YdiL (CAAX protease family)